MIVAAVVASGCSKGASPAPAASTPAPTEAAVAVVPSDAAPVSDAAASDAKSAEQTRIDKLVNQLDGTPYIDGLKQVDAMDPPHSPRSLSFGSCSWGIRAALALKRHGDPSFLPRRGAANDPNAIGRMLCLIANLPTSSTESTATADRRLELLHDFLPPRGKVKRTDEQCAGDNVGPPEVTSFTRGDAGGDELDNRFQVLDGCAASPVPGDFICSGEGRGYGTDVTLSPGAGGRLYIKAIDYQRIVGCD